MANTKSKPRKAPRKKKPLLKSKAGQLKTKVAAKKIDLTARKPSFLFHLIFLCSVSAYLFLVEHANLAGVSFLATVLIIYNFYDFFNKPAQSTGRLKEIAAWGFSFLFWMLACASLLSFPNFSYVLGPISFSLPQAYWMWIMALVAVAFFFQYLPQEKASKEINLIFSMAALVALLLTAFYIRTTNLNTPGGYYWDDWAVEVIDPLNIYDFHNFALIFTIGKREPFFSYFMAGIWYLFPKASMVFVQRLTCSLIDVGTVAVLYFLGKEIKSRRLGLILAALGVISIPLIIKCVCGMRLVSLPLAVALVLLAVFRLFHKPTLSRFIQWGIVTGFGAYTYTGFRLWIFYSIFTVLAWLVWDNQEKVKTKQTKISMILIGILSVLLFLQTGAFVSSKFSFLSFLLHPVIILLIGVLSAGFLIASHLSSKNMEDKKWQGWGWGVLTALLLIYPIISQEEITARMKVLSIFGDPEYTKLAFSAIGHFVDKVLAALQMTFFTWRLDGERYDLGIAGNDVFDFNTLIFMFLGLALLIAKPTKGMVFLLIGVLVGMLSYIFSFDSHSGKLGGCIVPVLVLAALGIDYYVAVAGDFLKKAGSVVAGIVLIGLLSFGGKINFNECFPLLLEPKYPDVILAHQATEDSKTYQVFLHPSSGHFANDPSQAVLEEENSARYVRSSNPIYLLPAEKGRDISVLIPFSDKAMVDQITKEFPKANWSTLQAIWEPDKAPFVHRVIIPIDQLAEKPGKLFYIQRITDKDWIRDFYDLQAGIARGVISEEDIAPLSTTIPLGLGGGVSARFRGSYSVTETGDHKFTVSTVNYVILYVDGKLVFDIRPRPIGVLINQSKLVHLEKGDHKIEYLVFYQNGREAPPINVLSPSGQSTVLGKL